MSSGIPMDFLLARLGCKERDQVRLSCKERSGGKERDQARLGCNERDQLVPAVILNTQFLV